MAFPMPADQASPVSSSPTSARKRKRLWLRELAVLVVALLAIQWWQSWNVPAGSAPAFEAMSADGRGGSLAAFRAAHSGQPVVVYFWADWCSICKAQQGVVDALRADVPVLTVAMQSGDAAAVAKVLRERGLTWPTLVDPDGAITVSYGLRGVPAMVVIGEDGRIRSSSIGYTTELGMRLRLWWTRWSA